MGFVVAFGVKKDGRMFMMRKNDPNRKKAPLAKPMDFVVRPRTKEEVMQQEIANDPEKAAKLLREILGGRK